MASESKGKGKGPKPGKGEDAESGANGGAVEEAEAAPEVEAEADASETHESAAKAKRGKGRSKAAKPADEESAPSAEGAAAHSDPPADVPAEAAKPPARSPEPAAPAPAKGAAPKAAAKPVAEAKATGDRPKQAPSDGGLHLITGFPGFIARRLLRKLAVEHPAARFGLLVQPHLVGLAEKSLAEADEAVRGLAARAELLPGDITEPGLAMEATRLERLLDEITVIWHLAAVYDLAVGRAVAYRVNVVGTANVLDLCERLSRLERLNYVSTCYVAGDREGLILETELDEGQGHKNHYEATKFWAELEVQRRWDKIPATIYRPGIVVGDSRTGETDKYDGPYYFIRFLQRLPEWMPMVNVGEGEALVNLVPVDYLVDAMVAISRNPDATAKVVQLADPNPMRARDLVALIMRVMGRRAPVGVVPSAWFDRLLRVRRVRRVLGMPREVLIYFNHQARFDVTQALELLNGSGVRCPHFSTYVRTLVDYVRRNPNKVFLDQRAL